MTVKHRDDSVQTQVGNPVKELISRERRAVFPSTPTPVQQEQFSRLKQLGLRFPVLVLQTKQSLGCTGLKAIPRSLSFLSWRSYLEAPGCTFTHPMQMAHAPIPMVYHYPLSHSNTTQSHSHGVPGTLQCCLTHLPIPSSGNIQQQVLLEEGVGGLLLWLQQGGHPERLWSSLLL